MKTTVKAYFKVIQQIHIALCLGAFVIIAILKYLRTTGNMPLDNSNLFLYVGIGLALIAILTSRIMFFNYLKTSQNNNVDLSTKLATYRTAMIIQMAILEGACFTNIMLFYLDGNDKLFGIAIALLLLMIIRRPNKADVVKVLFNGNEAMTRQLYDDNTEIDVKELNV
ncbi:MAG: hypothetical protein H6553_03575 [Chitinophagales bacterium]|nr:hypothetical protein [Chitinophagales bacterium]